jgi:mRNA interferase RelE/StbE
MAGEYTWPAIDFRRNRSNVSLMANVVVTAEAQDQFLSLPSPIQLRVRQIFVRLGDWPAVSGAKALRGDLKGSFRIRTGDYRVVFRPSADNLSVTVWKIGYRGGLYE